MSLMIRVALAVAATVATLAAGSPIAQAAPVPPNAGKTITFPYPAKAPVVVQMSGLGTVRERLHALIKNALPNDVEQIEKELDEGLKQLLNGRTLTAVPKDGRLFFVVHDIAALFDNTFAVSVLVPVTSYKEFRSSFLTAEERKTLEPGKNGVDEVKLNIGGEEHAVYVVDLKDFVAISPHQPTADAYTQKYAKATTDSMPAELAKSFLTSDVALYVNFDVINELYGNQIKGFRGLIDFAFMQGGMGGMIPGVSKKQLEAAKVLLQGTFQAVEDCHALVAGVEFRPEGVNLRLQAQFADNTTSTKLLVDETPGSFTELNKLPAGLVQYGGTRLGKTLTQTLRGLNAEFAPADDDEKGNKAVEKQLQALSAAGPRGEVSASGTPAVALTFSSFAEPKKAAAALVGCYEAMAPGGRVQGVVLKDTPKVAENARKHAGFTFTEIGLSFDFDATVKDLPPELKETTLAQIKRTVAEKMTAWVGTDGKAVVQVRAKDWESAVRTLDQALEGKKSIGDISGYRLTRKNLPPEVNFLLLLETANTATMLGEMLQGLEGSIPDFPKLGKVKPLRAEPSFIGVALTLKGDTATANLFIPAASIAVGQSFFHDLLKKFE